ncbi:hypothetical protein BRAS3809_3240018 [Bradyrhizobium sp. STM 3809]|nr:hypothetical protein BRAS3809_3240018 [Bradyrhizobium sp. STM 3809]
MPDGALSRKRQIAAVLEILTAVRLVPTRPGRVSVRQYVRVSDAPFGSPGALVD